MVSTNQIAEVGALVGEPARAAMLTALLDGRALTAAELARASMITPQTASSHLARLSSAGLLAIEKQGRHRYHPLAPPAAARMLEGLLEMAVGAGGQAPRPLGVGPRDQTMRTARTCYDHIAGRLGVAITDAMVARNIIIFEEDGGQLTPDGERFLNDLGIVLPERSSAARKSARPVCRP